MIDVFYFVLFLFLSKSERRIVMSIVTTSSRGQIVIPKDVRKKLQIGSGKRLLIRAEEDRAIIMPLPNDPVEHFCGVFQEKSSLTKALLGERRKEQAREAKKIVG